MFVLIAKLENGNIDCIMKSNTLAEVVAAKSKIELENKNFFKEVVENTPKVLGNISKEEFDGTDEEYQYFQSQLGKEQAQYHEAIQFNSPDYYGADLFIF